MLKRWTSRGLFIIFSMLLCASTACYRVAQVTDELAEPLTGPKGGQGGSNHIAQVTDELAVTPSEEIDYVVRHRLPSLTRMVSNERAQFIAPTMFAGRIEKIGIKVEECLKPEIKWKKIYNTVPKRFSSNSHITFSGKKSSELNACIAKNPNNQIDVTVREIELDEEIRLKSDVSLKGCNTLLKYNKEKRVRFAFLVEDCQKVEISGFSFRDVPFGIYCLNSRDIILKNSRFFNCSGRAVVLRNVIGARVSENRISKTNRSGVYVIGDSHDILIDKNVIADGRDFVNTSAGITVSSIPLADDPYDPDKHLSLSIRGRLVSPHDVLIYENELISNKAQGIYLDGPHLVYIVRNRIKGNIKEGICLDWGTIGAFVSENDILFNGIYFPDGQPIDPKWEKRKFDKLPGISLDNTMWNIIERNNISHNAGSGIKAVRSAIETIIFKNVITDNNLASSSTFRGYGVSLGNSGYGNNVNATKLMDFVPDMGCIVAANIISGKHHEGIHMAKEIYMNDVFNNVILGSDRFSIKNLSKRNNIIYDNIVDVGMEGVQQEQIMKKQ